MSRSNDALSDMIHSGSVIDCVVGPYSHAILYVVLGVGLITSIYSSGLYFLFGTAEWPETSWLIMLAD